jgi:hypothetical protein
MIGTSPPKQKLMLSVTLRAKMVVTAASTALPPFFKAARPAATASLPPAQIAPCLPSACQPISGFGFCFVCPGADVQNASTAKRPMVKFRMKGFSMGARGHVAWISCKRLNHRTTGNATENVGIFRRKNLHLCRLLRF